ncbi:MAG TPA: hypothetical protein VNB23_11415 [Ramlibacter sp.]|nr:hypothetical protein [Ramlibacter sp.]
MTSIDPTGKLLAYLRRQSDQLRRQPAPGTGAIATRKEPSRQGSSHRANIEIAKLDPADPQARRSAFRIFLRGVLTRELGAGVASDPGFPALVERVHDTMEADAELKLAIEQAGELLLKKAQAA